MWPGSEDECAAKAGKLSMLVVGISNALVDLGICLSGRCPSFRRWIGGLGGDWSHTGASVRGAYLRRRSLGPNSGRPPSP
jgi:hypothetical protein